jgi:hypothetical protein
LVLFDLFEENNFCWLLNFFFWRQHFKEGVHSTTLFPECANWKCSAPLR